MPENAVHTDLVLFEFGEFGKNLHKKMYPLQNACYPPSSLEIVCGAGFSVFIGGFVVVVVVFSVYSYCDHINIMFEVIYRQPLYSVLSGELLCNWNYCYLKSFMRV